MELVVDANILFSALIKDSLTAELLFDERLKLYAPEFIVDEFMKHQGLILKKTSRTKSDFVQIMHDLKEIITVIPEEEYSENINGAKSVSPDDKDVLYFALAMKLKCAIWSNDKLLKEQNKVKVYSTPDIKIILGR